MAYGQTGSGKSYTMLNNRNDLGIIFLSIKEILDLNDQLNKFKINLELAEIYCNKINILGKIPNLTEYEEGERLIISALSKRAHSPTAMNVNSSRSHFYVKLSLKCETTEAFSSRYLFQ